jgi:hypothetical protein
MASSVEAMLADRAWWKVEAIHLARLEFISQ